MKARDMLRDRVQLVLEKERYRKALERIVRLPQFDPDEHCEPELEDALFIARAALARNVKS